MPTVHDGIGTWYYGKQRIHRYKSTCSFCQRVGELASYDTTLYFVVFMVPLIPLGRKRIHEECPACRRHKVMSLKKWEAQKQKALAAVLEKPDDRDMNVAALGLAIAYQDEALFERLAPIVANDRAHDDAIQAQIGAGYGYFARWPEAEAAYRASLVIDDQPEIRRRLGWTLLKQHRPEEATPFFRHILEQKLKDEAGSIFLLIQAHQAEGLHPQALELMDERDAAFPELANLKEYKKQRQTSKRYESSGKKVKSAVLSESKQVGYQEGGWRASIPKFIGPLVFLGLLIWYLAAAYHQGQARQVFLVNGIDKPYTVLINGQEQNLQPRMTKSVQLPEGKLAMHFADLPLEPVQCRVETNFFTRPFTSPTFVINPDQLAILVWQQTAYSENPMPGEGQYKFHLGEILYSFSGIDFPFQQFPDSVPLKSGHTVTKTRIALAPPLNIVVRLNLASTNLDPAQQIDYAKRWLEVHSEDVLALYWLLAHLGDDAGLEYLKTGLAARPLRVEWHRAYQHLMEQGHPEIDLRSEYRRLVEETKGNPDARYLLARLEDGDVSDRLLRQAAEAQPPSAYPLLALGFQAMAEGQFPEAVPWLEKAVRLTPDHPQIWQGFKLALIAAKQYDRLLEEINKRAPAGHLIIPSDRNDRILALAAKGDQAGARAAIEEAFPSSPGQQEQQQKRRAELEMVLCNQAKDVPGYLKWAAQIPEQSRSTVFTVAFLNGKLAEAAQAADEPTAGLTDHALIYLAARKTGDQKLADQEWPKLLKALDQHSREARELSAILTGRQPFDATRVKKLHIEPLNKRVLLLVVAQRFPDHAKDLLPLARKLDFLPDATSLCLIKIAE